jgi:ankyrin repeat protein
LIKECRLNELEEFMMLNPNLPINTTDHAGNSFLIVASQCGFLEGVHLLLRKGANPNQTNVHINPLTKFDGDTALHRALAFNHYNVADCLVSNGAFSNIKNNKGLNPWAFTV